MAHAYISLDSLKLTIEDFVIDCSDLLPNPETKLVQQEILSSSKAFLDKENNTTPHINSNNKRLNALEGQYMEVTSKFQNILVSHVNKYYQFLPKSISFSQDLEKVRQEMISFVETIKKIKEEYMAEDLETRTLLLLYPVSPGKEFGGGGLKENMVVGLVDELEKLKDGLLNGSAGLKIVLVAGMGGIGKTTLVKQVYYDQRVSSYFDFRVFVKVGPECHINRILLDILIQLYRNGDKIQVTAEQHELASRIRDGLKGRRFLIVFDDVWNTRGLHWIQWFFQDYDVESRIILTTRLLQVADGFSCQVHQIRFLNKEESWNLFCKKVFVEQPCPPALEKVGKKIVQHCQGLPLGIISIASILSKAKKSLTYWEKVAENGNIVDIGTDEDTHISEVLISSYKHLPQHLKECFLYIGVFPINHEISVSKLVQLWVAEGLIEPEEQFKTIENTAEEYLEDLVSRSVVMIHQKSSSGRIRTCSIHYFFWHLCVREADEDKFFHIIKHNSNGTFSKVIHSHRRLCIHMNVLLGIESMSSVTHVRSFLCTGPNHQYPVPICLGSTSLGVLDALSIRSYKFPIEMVELVQLKYLAFTYNYGKLPSSISRLKKLLYLIVHRYPPNIINYSSSSAGGAPSSSMMPMEIWDMQELRHLQVMGSDLPDPGASSLPNLLTLFGVSACSCTKEVFQGISNLEKLGVRIVLTESADFETLRVFDHLTLLDRLKSFKCVVLNPSPKSQVLLFPEKISSFPYSISFFPYSVSIFPCNLQKLTLSGCGFKWKNMLIVSTLKYLQVLKLRCYAFQGPKWELYEKEFPKLEYLLIEDTDLVHWRVKDNRCFPQLQRLIIRHCYKLEELPSELGGIATLGMIELVDCRPSVVSSAKKIQKKQQEELQNKKLQVQVNSSWVDVKLKP